MSVNLQYVSIGTLIFTFFLLLLEKFGPLVCFHRLFVIGSKSQHLLEVLEGLFILVLEERSLNY